jgi:hypothetical protein
MLSTLQVITLLLVSICMAMSLAHALELPGKMRLSREDYQAVQPIYYPGFTIGGAVGEFGGMIATAVLLAFTPSGTPAFWLTAAALAALLLAHAVYWAVTHPVNKFWLAGQQLSGAGASFFAIGGNSRGGEGDFEASRDRWEFSHVARALLAFAALASLASATAIG